MNKRQELRHSSGLKEERQRTDTKAVEQGSRYTEVEHRERRNEAIGRAIYCQRQGNQGNLWSIRGKV